MLLADLTDMMLFRWLWPGVGLGPNPAVERGCRNAISVVAGVMDDAGVRRGVGVAGGGADSSDNESALDRRLPMLIQLTGRTLVLACGRAVGAGVLSEVEVFVDGPGDEKAALSFSKMVFPFFSPKSNGPRDLLFSWICDLRLSSSSLAFLCLSSCCCLFSFSSSRFFFLKLSLGGGLGRKSCGTKPEGYETICMEWGRRDRGPMNGAGRVGLGSAEAGRVRRSALEDLGVK